jgi:protocatechuate 3,4-dioxygenase beta subunit
MNTSGSADQRRTTASYFEVERSAEVVNARTGPQANPRMREVITILVRHLHEAVKEAAVTSDEWLAAIRFLTDTGHMCSAWRQEFILLSDVLGVSMLVDALNHERPRGATENTVLGPFHVAEAPRQELGANISLDGKGEPLLVKGRVVDIRGNPIPGVTLDVWQANEDGFYDVQQKGTQPEWNLRGVFQTDAKGEYWFRSAKPRWYPIPSDGPVGKLLAALDRHPNRAAHLHFMLSAPGYDTLITHIFVPDCPFLPEDAVFGVKDSLIADFVQVNDAQQAAALGMPTPFWNVTWDFVLARKDELRRGAAR